jgi:hypothetical protein
MPDSPEQRRDSGSVADGAKRDVRHGAHQHTTGRQIVSPPGPASAKSPGRLPGSAGSGQRSRRRVARCPPASPSGSGAGCGETRGGNQRLPAPSATVRLPGPSWPESNRATAGRVGRWTQGDHSGQGWTLGGRFALPGRLSVEPQRRRPGSRSASRGDADGGWAMCGGSPGGACRCQPRTRPTRLPGRPQTRQAASRTEAQAVGSWLLGVGPLGGRRGTGVVPRNGHIP